VASEMPRDLHVPAVLTQYSPKRLECPALEWHGVMVWGETWAIRTANQNFGIGLVVNRVEGGIGLYLYLSMLVDLSCGTPPVRQFGGELAAFRNPESRNYRKHGPPACATCRMPTSSSGVQRGILPQATSCS
jgi:hypothetical protein